ncbi:MAG TPA: glutamyl-tRNA reductase [Planctomycetota bacterium]|nr:glutamyl-tRNA reductase [Planctomycetota bacterium]
MDRIGVAGLSIHGTDVSGLERVRRPAPADAVAFLRELADELGASEIVFLATCNRIEVVYAREEGEPPSEADLDLLARHLCRPRGADASGDAATREPAGRDSATRERAGRDGTPRAAGVGAAGERTGRADADGAAPADVEALRALLLLRRGREAARHLFRVASSLDSLVVGEDQILAQVRSAYGAASDVGLVGPLLGALFHHALAVGKQVRSETELARHPVSLVNLAVHALLERPDAASMKVGIVGAGEMGALMARALAAAGMAPVVVANRSLAHARPVAADCGALALDLAALRRGEVPLDAIVSATSAPGHVLDAATLSALAARTPSGRPLLGIDLAVPRDLQPCDDPRVVLVDLDALRAQADRSRALRAQAAALAESIVDHKVDIWCRRFGERAASDVVTDLQASAEELVARELTGLLQGRLAHLSEEDRRAVERWARSTFGRLMHLPVTALKRLAADLTTGPEGDLRDDRAHGGLPAHGATPAHDAAPAQGATPAHGDAPAPAHGDAPAPARGDAPAPARGDAAHESRGSARAGRDAPR